jgi:alkaline phosphatase D
MRRRKFIRNTAIASTAVILPRFANSDNAPFFGNGVHNGWADKNSISIWTRLTQYPDMNSQGTSFIELTEEQQGSFADMSDISVLESAQIPENLSLKDMEGACPGTTGEVRISYYREDDLGSKITLDWAEVDASKNYTKQWRLTKLSPNTRYIVELTSRKTPESGSTNHLKGAFLTPPDSDIEKDISFAVVSCHDYNRRDHAKGHRIYPAMGRDELNFFVHTGDIEYYDKPNPFAYTEKLMRFKWDRLFALPYQRGFYNKTTSYFMKDDHDTLKDDAFPGTRYGAVSFERGLEIFDKEQFPSNSKTYKTIRWGKDLQIWLLEGRKYRSKNTEPDGPEKTILGKAQREWLFDTIDRSDATFKVIISASPIIGPDRPQGKNDNHSNKAFENEGSIIREFVNRHDNIYMCNGDRHWQYVSHIKDTNLWEFCTGAGSDSHAGGWKQENILPEHRFLRVKGGYLTGKVYRDKKKAHLKFEHRDVEGQVVHEEIFSQ